MQLGPNPNSAPRRSTLADDQQAQLSTVTENAQDEQSQALETAQAQTMPQTQAPGEGATLQPDDGQSGWATLLERFNAENSTLPNMLLVLGMMIIVFLMLRTLRRTSQANRERTIAMGSPAERIAELHERAEQSMAPSERLMVDAEAMARRLGAILDNKAARLELLIEEADMKLDQLNRAMSRADSPSSPSSSETDPVVSRPQPRTIDPSLLDRARLEQDQQEREMRVVERVEPAPSQNGTRPFQEPVAEISISDRVHELAMQGKSSQEIARTLQQPIGQVELILNLRRRAENT